MMDPVFVLFLETHVSIFDCGIGGSRHDTETFLRSGHPNWGMNCGDGHVLGCLA